MKKTNFFSGVLKVSLLIFTTFLAIPASAEIDECTASFDYRTNTLNIPCFNFDNQSLWLDLSLISADPIQFQVKNYGAVVPKFVSTDYIELDKIASISKFRSSFGHSYSDDFESCRSMKHYFRPKEEVDWSAVKIFSPVKGTISKVFQETAGTQVQIKADDYPNIFFIIFHINPGNPVNVGDFVNAGQQLGTHIGSQTMSDIAVGINTAGGWRLVSFFDVITGAALQGYHARGLVSRADLIISEEARNGDALQCDGEKFTDSGTIGNWIILE